VGYDDVGYHCVEPVITLFLFFYICGVIRNTDGEEKEKEEGRNMKEDGSSM